MRTVVYSKPFEQQLEKIIADARRADEFLRGVEWVLVRDPEAGHQLRLDSKLWFIASESAKDLSSMYIIYTYDDEKIHFLSIRLTNYG